MRRIFLIFFVLVMLSSFASASLTTDLVSYWKLDGNATDSVGDSDGTVSGATVTTSGKIGSAYDFDGTNDYINLGSPIIKTWARTSYSISVWVKHDSKAAYTTLYGEGSSSSDNHYGYIGLTDDFKPVISKRFASSANQQTISSSNAIDGNWSHIVYVVTGDSTTGMIGNTKIYVNGVNQSLTTLWNTGTSEPTINTNTIGSLKRTSYALIYDGLIDEIGIWSRALSADEINSLYNDGNGWSYPFTDYYYMYEINAYNSTGQLSNFNVTVSNTTVSYTYQSSNNTVMTNRTSVWNNGNYNITVKSNGYTDWGLRNIYWTSTFTHKLNVVMGKGGSTSQTCTGSFIVSSNCEAIIRNGNTYVVET